MARIKTDNDTWEATLENRDGERLVVFFCRSNGQRPYRVTLLDPDELNEPGALDGLSGSDLAELFGRSQSMNASPS